MWLMYTCGNWSPWKTTILHLPNYVVCSFFLERLDYENSWLLIFSSTIRNSSRLIFSVTPLNFIFFFPPQFSTLVIHDKKFISACNFNIQYALWLWNVFNWIYICWYSIFIEMKNIISCVIIIILWTACIISTFNHII